MFVETRKSGSALMLLIWLMSTNAKDLNQ